MLGTPVSIFSGITEGELGRQSLLSSSLNGPRFFGRRDLSQLAAEGDLRVQFGNFLDLSC
jgi:hypothetical protein